MLGSRPDFLRLNWNAPQNPRNFMRSKKFLLTFGKNSPDLAEKFLAKVLKTSQKCLGVMQRLLEMSPKFFVIIFIIFFDISKAFPLIFIRFSRLC